MTTATTGWRAAAATGGGVDSGGGGGGGGGGIMSWPGARNDGKDDRRAVPAQPRRDVEPSAPPLPASFGTLEILNDKAQQTAAYYNNNIAPVDSWPAGRATAAAARTPIQGSHGSKVPWVSATMPIIGSTPRRGGPAVCNGITGGGYGASNLLTYEAAAPPAEVSGLLGRLVGALKGLITSGKGTKGGGNGGGGGYMRGGTTATTIGATTAAIETAQAAVAMPMPAEDGREIIGRMRDILFADASLFKVEEGSGRVFLSIDGEPLRLRLRQQQMQMQGSPQQEYGSGNDKYDKSYDSDGVVEMQVGHLSPLELNAAGAEPLLFLHAAPGIYTFRCPPGQRCLDQ
ncbi:hypothetical protein Vafri_14959, partial [Volvox africanus]